CVIQSKHCSYLSIILWFSHPRPEREQIMRHRSAVLPLIAALAAVLLAAGLPVPPAVAAAHAAARANLAAGKPVTASSTQPGYPAGNATDGDQGSYWEGKRRLPAVD